jgi:hypothetical protein
VTIPGKGEREETEETVMFVSESKRGRLGFLGLCCAVLGMGAVAARAELTRGNRLLLQQGLNVSAYTFAETNGFLPELWAQTNFTGPMVLNSTGGRPSLYGAPGTFSWHMVYDPMFNFEPMVSGAQLPYLPHLKTWAYSDEQDITNPAMIKETGDFFDRMRADPRFDHVLFYANQWGQQFTEQQLKSYMAAAEPDMLYFDYYVWGTKYPFLYSNGSPTGIYRSMAKYRRLALAGNDGTGNNPIPWGHWLQNFIMKRDNGPGSQALGYRMSESELRLDQYSGWVFGAKAATSFFYDDAQDYFGLPLLLEGKGAQTTPTKEFYEMAKVTRESLNLGKTLVALHSTDVRMVKGPNTWVDNDVADFDATSDPFIKKMTPTNLGTTNEGKPGDVVAGWFRPLLSDLHKPVTPDETYFMIVNGLTWTNASAADTAQLIRLDFDFGDSGITSLQRLNRETGLVELVPLISDGGSRYHLDLTLPGGTGDLFKYNTGALFLVPEPGSMVGVCAGLVLLARRRGRR